MEQVFAIKKRRIPKKTPIAAKVPNGKSPPRVRLSANDKTAAGGSRRPSLEKEEVQG